MPLYLQVLFSSWRCRSWHQPARAVGGRAGALVTMAPTSAKSSRAGILAVSKGQREAALALGMTYGQLMRRIVAAPGAALRRCRRPATSSSPCSKLALVARHRLRARDPGGPPRRPGQLPNLEALIIAAVFYWVMTLIFSALQCAARKGTGARESHGLKRAAAAVVEGRPMVAAEPTWRERLV